MNANELIPRTVYKLANDKLAEFSRIGGTGMAVFHPPGEPDMQSSFSVDPADVVRPATWYETWYEARG